MTTFKEASARHDTDQPSIFVTTYNLYNSGLQFQNGLFNKDHEKPYTGFWINVSDYVYHKEDIADNFKAAGDHDPEIMFSDYESFPSELYSESGIDFEAIEEWTALDDDKSEIFEYLLAQGYSVNEALEKSDEFTIVDGDGIYDWCYEHSGIYELGQGHVGYDYFDWKQYLYCMECDGVVKDMGNRGRGDMIFPTDKFIVG